MTSAPTTRTMYEDNSYDVVRSLWHTSPDAAPCRPVPWTKVWDISSRSIDILKKTTTSVNTPGYWEMVKSGVILPVNPFHVRTEHWLSPATPYPYSGSPIEGACFSERMEGSWAIDPRDVSLLLPVVNDLARLRDAVVTQAVANARSATFDSLTFAAEAASTSRLLARNMHHLFNLLRGNALDTAYRKLRKKYSRYVAGGRGRVEYDTIPFFELVGEAFNAWMQMRYAILPIVYDTRDAVDTLTKRKLGITRQDGRGSLTVDLGRTEQSYTPPSESSPEPGFTETRVLSGSLVVRGSAIATSPTPPSLFAGDLLVTAWETVKFSWIIDWFVDVGDWLKSISAISIGDTLVQSIGVSEHWEYTSKYIKTYDYAGRTWGDMSRSGSGSNVASLTVDEYFRSPTETPWLPTFNPSLTPARVVDVAALSWQLVQSFYRAVERKRHHR